MAALVSGCRPRLGIREVFPHGSPPLVATADVAFNLFFYGDQEFLSTNEVRRGDRALFGLEIGEGVFVGAF